MKTKLILFTFGMLSLFLLAFTSSSMQNTTSSATKPTLIYIYDAYCGWCYGFSPVMNRFHQENKEKFSFLVLSGGLITGERIGPMDKATAAYIRKAVPQLEAYTGVKVSKAYLEALDNPNRKNDSNIPARALLAFRKYKPEQSVAFASWLQNQLFNEVRDLSEESVYRDAAKHFALPEEEFIQAMNGAQAAVDAEFDMVQSWGVRGFPAVILDRGDTLIALSNGYAPYEELEQSLQRAMELKIK